MNRAEADLAALPGLGPKSARMLVQAGIEDVAMLALLGPLRAYVRVRNSVDGNVSLNLLYALVGALENRDWRDVAAKDRHTLLLALDGFDSAKTEKLK